MAQIQQQRECCDGQCQLFTSQVTQHAMFFYCHNKYSKRRGGATYDIIDASANCGSCIVNLYYAHTYFLYLFPKSL
ncbi:TPA: hypothetical protein HA246_02095 [Candidatus Woesearchaeota archaeon]|nr:hypothetical protein [Candidatus Woesearchaeota archaeon]